MDALICSINSKYIHSSLAPWYLSAAAGELCRHTHSVTVAEYTINSGDAEITGGICSRRFDVLAFSCYIWNISLIKRILPQLRRALPHAVIIAGGPEVSFNSEDVLIECPELDFVIAHEGERPFSLLLDALEDGGDINIEGVYGRREDGTVYGLPPRAPERGDIPPSTYTDSYMKALNGRICYIEGSRGCPFSCSFCLSGEDRSVRFFDIERTESGLLKLAASGTKTVKFVDRTFNCNKKRSDRLIKFLTDSRKSGKVPDGVCFHLEVGADLFDAESLELIASAPPGLFQLEAGLQSFNAKSLEAVNRRTDMTKLTKNLNALISAGNVHVHIDLIAGLPYEDFESFGHSFDSAYALHPHMLQLGFLKLLHGSRIRLASEKYGYKFSSEPPYEIISNKFISNSELMKLHSAEDALERMYNSGRFRRTAGYLTEAAIMRPFELFMYTGSRINGEKMALDEYASRLFELCSALRGVDGAKLRDVMAYDLISCINTGRLPRCLHVYDSRIKQIKPIIAKKLGHSHFGLTPLVTDGVFIAADYSSRDPVSGQYKILKFDAAVIDCT